MAFRFRIITLLLVVGVISVLFATIRNKHVSATSEAAMVDDSGYVVTERETSVFWSAFPWECRQVVALRIPETASFSPRIVCTFEKVRALSVASGFHTTEGMSALPIETIELEDGLTLATASQLRRLRHLKIVSIKSGEVEAGVMAQLAKLNVEGIELQDVEAKNPSEIEALVDASDLEYLDLRWSNFSDEHVYRLKMMRPGTTILR